MTDPDNDKKSNHGEENEKPAIDNSAVSVQVDDLDESKTQLINSNGGAGGDHAEVAIVDGDKSSDHISFNGLGKDEVMQYANDPFWVRLRWVLFILFWVGWFAMLVTAILIIVLAPRCPPRPDLKWYQKETVYQAYSKSFKDSDKDGFGDFQGLKDKFDYVTDDMGSNAVYLNAILKTDETGLSNDEKDKAIVDHKDLHSSFGTTVDRFKSWIKNLRKKGQNVIVDLIPNHTSKKHEWFEKSKKSDGKYKDYYIWAGSAGNSPNSWTNKDGSSGWEYDSDRQQWYYHSYSKDLPDLDLNNEDVRQEIKDIMKFWFGAGVGGFNIQDLDYLVEANDTSAGDARNMMGTLELLKELRAVANDYSDKPGRERFLFGNVQKMNNDTAKYWGDDEAKALHMVLPAMPFSSTCDATCISEWIGNMPDGGKKWLGLQLGNQDSDRITSKASSGSEEMFGKIARAIQMLLPGTPFNYYGDEFGQESGTEIWTKSGFNPNNARTPMQWTGEKTVGFTEMGVTPWNPVGPNYENNNLRVSRAHYNKYSSFRLLTKLIELRGKESFQWGKTKACAPNKDLLLFTRKAERFPYYVVMMNVGKDTETPHLPSLKDCVDSKDVGKVVFHSSDDDGDMRDFEDAVRLNPGDIMVVEFAADDE